MLFSRVAAPACITPTVYEGSPFSTSSPTLVFCVFDFSHSDRCEVVSHCGFDLYFPDAKCCWALFHVSVGYLDVFFAEMSVHVCKEDSS